MDHQENERKSTSNYYYPKVKSYSLRSDSDTKRINYKEFLNSRLNGSNDQFVTNSYKVEKNQDHEIIIIDSSSEEEIEDNQEQKNDLSNNSCTIIEDEPANKNAETVKTKSDRDEDKNSDLESDDDDENMEDDKLSWVSENEKEKLWCICQKPWDKRFMIMCDECMDWYHGDCVGLTKEDGKKLQRNDEKFICPFCNKGLNSDLNTSPEKKDSNESEIDKRITITKKNNSTIDNVENKKSSNNKSLSKVEKKVKENFKDFKLKFDDHSDKTNKFNTLKDNSKTKIQTSDNNENTCINHNCKNKRMLKINESLFCSESCIKKYVTNFINNMKTDQKIKFYDTSTKIVKVYKDQENGVSNKAGLQNRLYTIFVKKPYYKFHDANAKSNKPEGPVALAKQTPKLSIDMTEKQKISESHKEKIKSENKIKSIKLIKPGEEKKVVKYSEDRINEELRHTTRKSLIDALSIRLQESNDSDLKVLDLKDNIRDLVQKIEEEMFKFYGERNSNKYKLKYRSLCFNIKDKKNNLFFKKILLKEIQPKVLITMTSEEMASKELSEWREKETRQELQAIERAQIEASKDAKNKRTIKISHKGEFIVRDEDMSDLSYSNTVSTKTLNNIGLESNLESEKDFDNKKLNCADHNSFDAENDVNDTTKEHNTHLFDIYCKICTGVIAPTGATTKTHENKDMGDNETLIASKSNQTTSKNDVEINFNVPLTPLSPITTGIFIEDKDDGKIAFYNDKTNDTERKDSQNLTSAYLSQEFSKSSNTLLFNDTSLSSFSNDLSWNCMLAVDDGINLKASFLGNQNNYSSLFNFEKNFPVQIELLGRVEPDTALNYVKNCQNIRDIIFIKFEATETLQHESFTRFIGSLLEKSRFGVVKTKDLIKELYLVPVRNNKSIPGCFEFLENEFNLILNFSSDLIIGILVLTTCKKKACFVNTEISLLESSKRKICDDLKNEELTNKRPKSFSVNDNNNCDINSIGLSHNAIKANTIELCELVDDNMNTNKNLFNDPVISNKNLINLEKINEIKNNEQRFASDYRIEKFIDETNKISTKYTEPSNKSVQKTLIENDFFQRTLENASNSVALNLDNVKNTQINNLQTFQKSESVADTNVLVTQLLAALIDFSKNLSNNDNSLLEKKEHLQKLLVSLTTLSPTEQQELQINFQNAMSQILALEIESQNNKNNQTANSSNLNTLTQSGFETVLQSAPMVKTNTCSNPSEELIFPINSYKKNPDFGFSNNNYQNKAVFERNSTDKNNKFSNIVSSEGNIRGGKNFSTFLELHEKIKPNLNFENRNWQLQTQSFGFQRTMPGTLKKNNSFY